MLLNVKFYGPFNYSIYPIIIFIILFIIVLLPKKKKHQNTKVEQQVKAIKQIDKNSLKKKYLDLLDNLNNEVINSKISNRKAYNKISRIIREFVYEVTNIDVRKYSLKDIDKNKFKSLYELIQEYYEPEFSYDKEGNIELSIQKTKEVIKKWN